MEKLKLFMVALAASFLLAACEDNKLSEGVDYDRTAFLQNMSDNLIIPAFKDYAEKVNALNRAAIVFEENPTESNLLTLRNSLKAAWLTYQYVAYLEVGPSADVFFREEVNIFPTDTSSITSKINQGDYQLSGATNIDVKGFPAVDYLVNGSGISNQDVIEFYTDESLGSKRLSYLKAVVLELEQMAQSIEAEWTNYRTTFIESLGTDIGSSTGILVNEFNKQFDIRLKNGKIGIPAGVKSFERTNPDKVECLYGGYSKELAIASAQASLDIFKGVSYTGQNNGEGFDDYLDGLNATVESGALSLAITDAIQQSIEKIEAIELDFNAAAQVYQADGDLVNAYNSLQAVIPLIKVDMTSEMGVTVAFQDNDGD